VSDSIPIDPKTGLNPVLTVCRICGEQNGELALAGDSWSWRHRKCNQITVCYRGQGPSSYDRTRDSMRCDGCGESADYHDWDRLGPYEPERDGPMAGHGPCDRCKEWLAGGVIVKCSKCRRIYEFKGAFRALHEFDPRPYAGDYEKALVDGHVERVVGKVMPTDECHFCAKTDPTPETADG